VHREVVYDVEVETADAGAEDCARAVVTAKHLS